MGDLIFTIIGMVLLYAIGFGATALFLWYVYPLDPTGWVLIGTLALIAIFIGGK